MAYNERVQWSFYDIAYQQFAQAGRTKFYPGKADCREGDMAWEKDFRIPTGTPAFDEAVQGSVKMQRVRIIKTKRNSVSDMTIPVPQMDSYGDTVTQDNDGVKEKTSGYDWLTGN
jgi:hypothetical protein